jgi:hypothetical protein
MRARSSSKVGIAMLAGLLALAGCATRVSSDFDRDAVFAYYNTFDWLSPPARASEEVRSDTDPDGPFERNSLLDKRIRSAVNANLTARGFRYLESGEADFRMNYYVRFKDKLYATGNDFGYWGRYYRGGFGSGFNYSVRQYQEGTIILDIIDRKQDQLVWRGWAVTRSSDGNLDEAEVSRAVARILERFPPPAP